MKTLIALLLLTLRSAAPTTDEQSAVTQSRPTEPAARFTAVDVFIDSGDKPLAAYQFELKAQGSDVMLAGVEGVAGSGFNDPPYYDAKASLNNRIVIAAFSTGTQLPSGKTRVATLHLRIAGPEEPKYAATLQVAADADAKSIPATISVVEGAKQ